MASKHLLWHVAPKPFGNFGLNGLGVFGVGRCYADSLEQPTWKPPEPTLLPVEIPRKPPISRIWLCGYFKNGSKEDVSPFFIVCFFIVCLFIVCDSSLFAIFLEATGFLGFPYY